MGNKERDYIERTKNRVGYTYLMSFRKGDTLPSGEVVKSSPKIKLTHDYCGMEVIVSADRFFNRGANCTSCCGSYEKSFAHHIEVELGLNIDDIWDFEKNTVNPYHISKHRKIKVWIKCKQKDYHGSYEVLCSNYVRGMGGCSYCASQKVHPLDSFGYYNFEYVMSWHTDNELSPFEVARYSHKKYMFKCLECGKEYKKQISLISVNKPLCRNCSSGRGEDSIINWLTINKISYEHDSVYFKDLIGAGGGKMRPDFILPNYKIWIEYDGVFHFVESVEKGYQTRKQYQRMVENDKIKDIYANENGWELIRIPYIELRNIKELLNKKIIKRGEK